MVKYAKQLFPAIVVSIITIMACQKQENVNMQQTHNKQNSTLTMSRTDNKDYKIPRDTAIAWVSRWDAMNKSRFNNQMINSITIPIDGLLQLQQEAVKNNTPISGVRLYLSVDGNNRITAMYVPVDQEKNDILYYRNQSNNIIMDSTAMQTFDGVDPCPGGGCPKNTSLINTRGNDKENL